MTGHRVGPRVVCIEKREELQLSRSGGRRDTGPSRGKATQPCETSGKWPLDIYLMVTRVTDEGLEVLSL